MKQLEVVRRTLALVHGDGRLVAVDSLGKPLAAFRRLQLLEEARHGSRTNADSLGFSPSAVSSTGGEEEEAMSNQGLRESGTQRVWLS